MTQASLAQLKERLLELLKRLSFEEREVTLSSGKKSNFYIDCKQTALTAEGHFLIGSIIHELLAEHFPTAQAVGGLTMGADPIASAVATMSVVRGRPTDAFYVRKEAKGHGTQKWLEGDKTITAGMAVVVVEDVCTTGASTLLAIERARLHGLKVLGVITLVDRQEGGREKVETQVPVVPLFGRSDFLP